MITTRLQAGFDHDELMNRVFQDGMRIDWDVPTTTIHSDEAHKYYIMLPVMP